MFAQLISYLIILIFLRLIHPGGIKKSSIDNPGENHAKKELSGRVYGFPSRERLHTQDKQGLRLGSGALAWVKQPLRL
jgi:hypothetical protein